MAKIADLFRRISRGKGVYAAFISPEKNIISIYGREGVTELRGGSVCNPWDKDGDFFVWLKSALSGYNGGAPIMLVLPDCVAFTDSVRMPRLDKCESAEALDGVLRGLSENYPLVCFERTPIYYDDGLLCLVTGIKKSLIDGIRTVFDSLGLTLWGITVRGEMLCRAVCSPEQTKTCLIRDGERLIFCVGGGFAGSIELVKDLDDRYIEDIISQNECLSACGITTGSDLTDGAAVDFARTDIASLCASRRNAF